MKMKTKTVCLAALFTALICLGGMISLPVGPIPVVLVLVMIFFAALYLPFGAALASVAAYLALGAVGLPVFSGFQGGFQVLLGPTGGYLIGYLAIPAATALCRKLFGRRSIAGLLGCVLGLAACYALGTAQYAFLTATPFLACLPVCVLPFLPFDLVKILAAFGLTKALPRLSKRR